MRAICLRTEEKGIAAAMPFPVEAPAKDRPSHSLPTTAAAYPP